MTWSAMTAAGVGTAPASESSAAREREPTSAASASAGAGGASSASSAASAATVNVTPRAERNARSFGSARVNRLRTAASVIFNSTATCSTLCC